MPEFTLGLTIASFIAGLLMFVAPCTLPLVPAYLAFISGVKADEATTRQGRQRIINNGLAFVLGFTVIFVLFGMLAGFFGSFIGAWRSILTQVGGGLIIIFGLMMLGVINITPLLVEKKLPLPRFVVPGHPSSAFAIGSIFALGWTPCVGPVLASVLLLATTTSTAHSGGFQLFIFSLGLAVPFLVTSFLYARVSTTIAKYASLTQGVHIVGGVFLVLLGGLLLTDNFELTIQYGYQLFEWLGIGNLLDFY